MFVFVWSIISIGISHVVSKKTSQDWHINWIESDLIGFSRRLQSNQSSYLIDSSHFGTQHEICKVFFCYWHTINKANKNVMNLLASTNFSENTHHINENKMIRCHGEIPLRISVKFFDILQCQQFVWTNEAVDDEVSVDREEKERGRRGRGKRERDSSWKKCNATKYQLVTYAAHNIAFTRNSFV